MERSQYARFALVDSCHWWFRARRQMAHFLVSKLGLPPSATILDVGTGSGGMIPVLSQYGRLTVYEPDPDTLALTQEKFEPRHDDVTFLSGNFPDVCTEQYDLITAFDVLEHCPDDEKALSDWSSLLKDNAFLLITVPAFPSLWGKNDELSHHFRRYTKATLRQVLGKTGFTLRKLSYTNFALFGPVWVSRNVKEKVEKMVGINREEPWDFEIPPTPINEILLGSVSWERFWVEKSSLPLGTSLLCIARKGAAG